MIKLLIGGSPCTYWSIAQKNNRETKAEGLGGELFKNYLIAKEKFKPDYFLYENNKSAAKAIKEQIKHELKVWDGSLMMEDSGARYIEINSALVSAQNRQRFYVHNCGEVEQPEDRGILLKDILETTTGEPIRIPHYGVEDKARPIEALYANHAGTGEGSLVQRLFSDNPNKQQNDLIAEPVNITADGKSQTIKAQYQNTSTVNICCYTSTYGATGVAEPVNVTADGKSHTIKAQYYKNGIANFICNDGYNATAVAEPFIGQQTPSKIYEVKDGQITIKDKQYPIKLADGYYIIRKLTVKECCRLQTMPDDYCRAVSNAQAYKGLGNGWTVEVVKHILNNKLKDIPKDEKIVVLSMYDGIGTGRYILDSLGFTNVKYYAYEIDKYAMQIAKSNYPDIIELGDAFQLRNEKWGI